MNPSDLQQMVNEITDQILASLPAGAPVAPKLAAPVTAPDAARLAAIIDHTELRPEATEGDIVRLCEEALRHGFATVCVSPIWVSAAERILRNSSVGVCTVAGFPSGATTTDAKRAEAEIAIRNGASEVDMVLPVGRLKQGDWDAVKQDIGGVAEICNRAGVVLKVILESAALTETEIAVACALAKLAGAGFVKTSTGFHPAGGAKVEHVALMRRAVGDGLGVKASGGIRTLADARAMVAAGATRIGASRSVEIVREAGSTA